MDAKFTLIGFGAIMLQACTSQGLNHALGTPKNPIATFANPELATPNDHEANFLSMWYSVLLQPAANPGETNIPEARMRPYIAAGYALSDFYCSKFFIKTDEAYRRRSFGRAATNDVGTVVQSILGLANAGKDVITGLGTATGLADSIWRHYDTAFLISPDLSGVQGLLHAEQANFRARTLGPDAKVPSDYATAQSTIMKYANACSFLGLQALMNRAANERREQLNRDTESRTETPATETGTTNTRSARSATASETDTASDLPAGSAEPALAPNEPETTGQSAAILPSPPLQDSGFVARWGTEGPRQVWSSAVLQGVKDLGGNLTRAGFVPSDIAFYCPNYRQLTEPQRQMFWAALLSSLAKPESNFNPLVQYEENFNDSKGQRVISRGLLQLSHESANLYGCGITSAAQLHDPTTNLRCGVRILNRLVGSAEAVAVRRGGKWNGAAAYWSPFRKAGLREDMAGWVRVQPYCRVA